MLIEGARNIARKLTPAQSAEVGTPGDIAYAAAYERAKEAAEVGETIKIHRPARFSETGEDLWPRRKQLAMSGIDTIDLGDRITFGFEFAGQPAGTIFIAVETVGADGVKAARLVVNA